MSFWKLVKLNFLEIERRLLYIPLLIERNTSGGKACGLCACQRGGEVENDLLILTTISRGSLGRRIIAGQFMLQFAYFFV